MSKGKTGWKQALSGIWNRSDRSDRPGWYMLSAPAVFFQREEGAGE
jgi:hypothetical protein